MTYFGHCGPSSVHKSIYTIIIICTVWCFNFSLVSVSQFSYVYYDHTLYRLLFNFSLVLVSQFSYVYYDHTLYRLLFIFSLVLVSQFSYIYYDILMYSNVSKAITHLRAVIRLRFIGLCDVIVHTEQTDMYEA